MPVELKIAIALLVVGATLVLAFIGGLIRSAATHTHPRGWVFAAGIVGVALCGGVQVIAAMFGGRS